MDLYKELIRKRYLEAKAKQAAELEQAREAEHARERRVITDRQKSPAERLLPAHEDRLREARERPPVPAIEVEEKTKVAEQMKAQPSGLQRAPSPGGPGVTYSNPRAWRPMNQPGPQIEPLFDQAARKRAENRAAKTEQELANERHERAQRELDRFLDLPRR